MSYNISKVQYHTVQDNERYLLDSNIWIEILTSRNTQKAKNKQYMKLFGEVQKNTKVKIVLPALLVSEVVNRILREVHMKKYAWKNGFGKNDHLPPDYYKSVYRKSDDFRIAYNLLCDDIKGYAGTIELINDKFGTDIKYKHVMKDPPQGLDFNDNYYYILCKKEGYIMVTDDKDFWVEDIKIITESESLIQKQYEETAKMARLRRGGE